MIIFKAFTFLAKGMPNGTTKVVRDIILLLDDNFWVGLQQYVITAALYQGE